MPPPPLLSTDPLAALLLLAALATWLACELHGALTRNAPAGTRADRFSREALGASSTVGLLLGLEASLRGVARIDGGHALFFAGLAVMAVGLLLRGWAVRSLGELFTGQVSVREAQRVVSHGPYRWVRHPGYAGTLISLLGLGLAFENWLSLAALGLTLPALAYRIQVEERALVARVAGYAAYARGRRRLLPFLL